MQVWSTVLNMGTCDKGLSKIQGAQIYIGEVLLGTKKGLEAMMEFLTKTGTFTKTGKIHGNRTNPEEDNEENAEDKERWGAWMETGGERE